MTPPAEFEQVVPFLGVIDMTASIRFYVDGLGFAIKHRWDPDGKLRWCWLTRGRASIMLQEYIVHEGRSLRPDGVLGQGMSLCFILDDAVAFYREATARGLAASEPMVGNSMWVTAITDPDGYQLNFESMTDVPEETRLSDVAV